MFKNNMKFTGAAYWINSKISNRDRNTTFITIVGLYYGVTVEGFNAVELHFLNYFKVNCSNAACSPSMRLIFNKKHHYEC